MLWGLDAKNVWCNIVAWGELATVLRAFIIETLQHGVGHTAFSGLRHQHPVKNEMYEAMAFKAEAGCRFKLAGKFRGDNMEPEVAVNGEFAKLKGYTGGQRCFITAKVHERRDLIGA